MSVWRTATIDVRVYSDDWERAREKAIERGESGDWIVVEAEVDIDEALEEATVDQLREALGREDQGYTQDQLDAVRDCFAALANGDHHTASAMLARVFDYPALIAAAEAGMGLYAHRWAA